MAKDKIIQVDYEEAIDDITSGILEASIDKLLQTIVSELSKIGVFEDSNGYSKRDIFIELTDKILNSVDSDLKLIKDSFTQDQLSFVSEKNTEIVKKVILGRKRAILTAVLQSTSSK